MHRVVVVAYDGVVPFDLSVPVEVFGRARRADGAAAYQVRVCGATDEVRAGAFGLRVPYDLSAMAEADTVVVPGIADLDAPLPEAAPTGPPRPSWPAGIRASSSTRTCCSSRTRRC